MLYEPQRHEPLSQVRWDERSVHDVIAQIVAEADASFDPSRFWPAHPRDETQGVLKGLWFGAAGVIWALRFLTEQGAARAELDCDDAIARVHARYLTEDDPRIYAGSFLMGELGILLVHWLVCRERFASDRLFELIDRNVEQPTDELMWGAPGAALAASFMWESTGEERWRDLFLRKVGELWTRWKYRPEQNGFFWRQRLYRPVPRILLGPVHGFAGNAAVMLRAAPLMTEERREAVYDRIAQAIRATAYVEGGWANWLPLADPPATEPEERWLLNGVGFLLQWCHGAPGTLGAIFALPKDRDAEMDALFIAGGELTYTAGPLTKGPNLCHGTGGNGVLFLNLYQRTGDVKWLERARSFAMHGIKQYRGIKADFGHGWYSLWTGDIGFAIYLWQCIKAESGFPTVDFL